MNIVLFRILLPFKSQSGKVFQKKWSCWKHFPRHSVNLVPLFGCHLKGPVLVTCPIEYQPDNAECGCIFTSVTIVWLFSPVHFQMCPQMACIRPCLLLLVTSLFACELNATWWVACRSRAQLNASLIMRPDNNKRATNWLEEGLKCELWSSALSFLSLCSSAVTAIVMVGTSEVDNWNISPYFKGWLLW